MLVRALHAQLDLAADPDVALERELARWARLSTPNHLYAYCFCDAQ